MLGHRYSTGSNLNANSALIQNLYSQETTPLRAVHLAIDTGLEESGNGADVKAY
jgi:translation initiation factor 3 subunit F